MLILGLADVALIAWYIGVLVLLEGLLSADNALVLAVMVRHLPKNQQRRVLIYGIWGAVGFRVLALLLSSMLLVFLDIARSWAAATCFIWLWRISFDAGIRRRIMTMAQTPRPRGWLRRLLGNGHRRSRWPTSPSRLIRFSPPSAWPRVFPPISAMGASFSSSSSAECSASSRCDSSCAIS